MLLVNSLSFIPTHKYCFANIVRVMHMLSVCNAFPLFKNALYMCTLNLVCGQHKFNSFAYSKVHVLKISTKN